MHHIQVHVSGVAYSVQYTRVHSPHMSALTRTYICVHLPHMVRMHSPHVRVYSMYDLNVFYVSSHDIYT